MAAASRHSPESTAALIVGAGSGVRFGGAKAFVAWRGEPLIWWAARPFARAGEIGQVVLVVRREDLEEARSLLGRLGCPGQALEGGATRSESVRRGLAALPPCVNRVLVHDAARPNLSAALLRRILGEQGPAVVPCLQLHDAMHRLEPDGLSSSVDRSGVVRVQTPQAFDRNLLEQAHAGGEDAADDAALVERLGIAVRFVPGEEENLKVTTPEDIRRLERFHAEMLVGHGYDIHRLAAGRRLVLCGVEIPSERGALGHSDADAATHALMDAILGAAGLPDIGHLFPPEDERYRDARSVGLLADVVARIRGLGLQVAQADLTVVLENPRVGPYRETMRQTLADVLQLPAERVSVKATTAEGLGAVGGGEAIEAWALATLRWLPR